MTEDQKAKLAALIQEMRANQHEKDKTVAKMLRLVLQVLDPNIRTYADSKTLEKIRKDKAALPAALRDIITMLEKY